MSIEIKYKNLFGDQLTIQQVQLLNDNYQQEQYVDSALKRIDFYKNKQIYSGVYYLSPEENLQSILTELQSIWRDGYFYINTQTVGNYTIRDWEVYEGLVKLSKGQTVYDNQGREIAEHTLDLNTLAILKTTKNYYLQTFGKFNNNDDILNYGVLEFNYNYSGIPTGQISVMINLPGFEHRDYYINDQQNILLNPLIADVFSWNEQSYYHSDTPFIPGTTA